MSDHAQPFVSGERFVPEARVFNRWNETSAQLSALIKQGAYRPEGSPAHDTLAVRNSTAGTLSQFSVIGLGSALVAPAMDLERYLTLPAVEGVAIDEDNTSKFAIVQRMLASGDIDPEAVVSGICYARLTGEEGMARAKTIAGATALEASGDGPCAILYDPGPGEYDERIALIRLGGAAIAGTIIAKITSVANISGMGLISEDCGYADAIVRLATPGAPVKVGDAVKIWDAGLCWFNLPVDLLENLRVVATLYRKPDPDSTEDCATAMLYEGENIWIAQGVCCAEAGY